MVEQRARYTLPGNEAGEVQVHLLDGGSFSTATLSFLHANVGPDKFRLYDWCFLIFHRPSGRYVLWDLGCSNDNLIYTPWVQEVMVPSARPVGPRQTLTVQLNKLGITAGQISSVIFSHAHWDHYRPISQEFPNAKSFFGPGTKAYCTPGHFENGQPTSAIEWDGRFFDISGFATEVWEELDGTWIPLGPFDRGLDFFGDGSFWIIDAPGHMPGNLCAAAKLEGIKEWVLLGSDCCHSQALLNGEAEMACFTKANGVTAAYLHMDVAAARDTIERIKKARSDYGMHVALAHDDSWLIDQSDKVLMTLLSEHKKGEWLERVKQNVRP
ncbi:beta-lactamase-like protein [Ilyonectria destructans]|nr:beta-lactamase-like protein [Ilyonectria destructans]